MEQTGPAAAPGAATARLGPSVSPRRALFLWLLVLVQLAIPASYYLVRADREDERFAWRMFSAQRFRSCQVKVYEQAHGRERKLSLAGELHASWIGALRRGRMRVIERFLHSRCERPEVEVVTLLRSCRELDESRLPEQRFSYRCGEDAALRAAEGPLP